MTQYSTNSDFSTDSASTTTDESNLNTVTNWTWRWTGTGDWAGVITSDAGAEGGKYIEFDQSASASEAVLLSMDGPGSIATQTETDVLFRFRLGGLTQNVGAVRAGGTLGNDYYALAVDSNGDVRLQRWQDTAAQQNVGALITKGLSATTWYWARINVTSAGSWSWRVWSGAVGDELGTWDMTGTTNTANEAGYVGPNTYRYQSTPVDYDWFSVGTAGDSAPSPGGGEPPFAPLAVHHLKQLMG